MADSNVNVGAISNSENFKENLAPVKNSVQSNIISTQSSSREHMSFPSNETAIERMTVLTNGCSYKVDNSRIFLKNTCAFDSIAHVRNISIIDGILNEIVNL